MISAEVTVIYGMSVCMCMSERERESASLRLQCADSVCVVRQSSARIII